MKPNKAKPMKQQPVKGFMPWNNIRGPGELRWRPLQIYTYRRCDVRQMWPRCGGPVTAANLDAAADGVELPTNRRGGKRRNWAHK